MNNVLQTIQVSWDVTLCHWVSGSRHFKGQTEVYSSGTSVSPLKTKALCSFITSRTTHPLTQHYSPEDLTSQKQCCENLKSLA